MTNPGLTFEDLMREVQEFPSPEVRLAGLGAVCEVLEEQMEVARHAEIEKLRQRHAREGTHPEDAELDWYELEDQVTHLFPKVFRGGFVLALWSILEACTKDLAAYGVKQTGKVLPKNHFKQVFIEASEQAFQKLFGISAFQTEEDREALRTLAGIRAALVHHNGAMEHLPSELRVGGPLKLEQAGLYVRKDLHHEYFVPTREFVEVSFALVDRHLRSLAARVKQSVKAS